MAKVKGPNPFNILFFLILAGIFVAGGLWLRQYLPRPLEVVEKTPAHGDTLVVGTIGAPLSRLSLDPFAGIAGFGAIFIKTLVYNSLVKYNASLHIVPALAESWQVSPDRRVWTFTLRRGVKFHDGQPLTARDVKFTLETVINNKDLPLSKAFDEPLRRVKMLNPWQVQLILAKPSPSFLASLEIIPILPAHLLQADPFSPAFSRHPVGTGPFRFAGVGREKEIILTRNPEYFEAPLPYLDGVVIRNYKSTRVLWARLGTEDIDFAFDIPPTDAKELADIPFIKNLPYLNPFYFTLTFNLTHPLFQDKRVRQALSLAINRQELIDEYLLGQGIPAAGIFTPGSWAADPQLKADPYDPTQAQKLLTAAGWRDENGDRIRERQGVPLRFTVLFNRDDAVKEKMLSLIQKRLQEVGAQMFIKEAGQEEFIAKILQRKFEVAFIEYSSRIDPSKSAIFWHSASIKKSVNFAHYRNPVVDSLYAQDFQATTQQEREQIYHQLDRLLHEDVPAIFLFYRQNTLSVHKRFHGIDASALWMAETWYVPKQLQKHRPLPQVVSTVLPESEGTQ